jgi:hypothetical protein
MVMQRKRRAFILTGAILVLALSTGEAENNPQPTAWRMWTNGTAKLASVSPFACKLQTLSAEDRKSLFRLIVIWVAVMLQTEEADTVMSGSTSCGYGPLGPLTWPSGAFAKVSATSALWKPGAGCGACIEVCRRTVACIVWHFLE